jgi:hypothetical protein
MLFLALQPRVVHVDCVPIAGEELPGTERKAFVILAID